MSAPGSTSMERGVNPPTGYTAESPDFCCCVWRVEKDYYEKEFKAEHAELVVVKQNLASSQSELKSTSESLLKTSSEAKALQMDNKRLADQLDHAQKDLTEAVDHVHELTRELKTTRGELDKTVHEKAHARWNLAAGVEKAEAMKARHKTQSEIRKKLIHQSEEEKGALVKEVMREREELAKIHEQRATNIKAMRERLLYVMDDLAKHAEEDMQKAMGALNVGSTRKVTVEAVQRSSAGLEDPAANLGKQPIVDAMAAKTAADKAAGASSSTADPSYPAAEMEPTAAAEPEPAEPPPEDAKI